MDTSRGQDVKVLLVDDSSAIQQSFGALIATAPGVEVVGFAVDVASALEAVAQHRPDLVVLDARLRGQDRGLDVLLFVRQNYPGVKVIMFSQYAWASMRETHMQAGAVAYFDKAMEFHQARDYIAELSSAAAARPPPGL